MSAGRSFEQDGKIIFLDQLDIYTPGTSGMDQQLSEIRKRVEVRKRVVG